MTVGILAFQGDVAEHRFVVERLGHDVREIRTIANLSGISHLIIPGGESTVMARFLAIEKLDAEILRRVNDGSLAVFGTCAGAILMGKKALGKNAPRALGLIDIDADRNAYGTQIDSFETDISVKGLKKPVPVAFIRAPKIVRTGKGVEVLAKKGSDIILVRQGRVLVSTCHPEARGETAIHELFLTF